jgi:hypothetical protein
VKANVLIRLPMPLERFPHPEVLDSLRLNQRNVEDYQFNDILQDAGWQAFASEEKRLARIKHVQLRVLGYEECEHEMVVLDHLPELTSLDIDFWGNMGGENGLDYHALFFCAVKLQKPRPWLKSLRLNAVSLTCGSDEFPRLSGLQCLKHLQLTCCANYNAFLGMLATFSLDLESSAISEMEGEEYFDARANMFTQSMSSLQRLRLYDNPSWQAPYDDLLDWTALYACASAIQCLRLEFNNIERPFPSTKTASDSGRFCSSASNLQQLSITGIEVEPKSWTSCSDPNDISNFLVSLGLSMPQRRLSLTISHRIAYVQYAR